MSKYRIPNEFNQSDKIGNLAIPQVVVLAMGAIVFVLCIISLDIIPAMLSAIPIGLFTFAFMFVKVNKIPLYEFLLVYLLYMGTPKLLIFRSDNLKDLEEQEETIGFIEPKYKKTSKKQTNTKRVTTKKNSSKPKVINKREVKNK